MDKFGLVLKQKGFTLIEMLIALAIGAGIATMTYQALDNAIRADAKISKFATQVDEIDRAWQYIGNDLSYAVERTWFNRNGEQKSALLGVFGDRLSQSDVLIASEDDYLLQFVRGNRSNPKKQKRSNLYMVGYRVTQDDADSDLKSLWRDTWTPVDGSGDEGTLQRRRLLASINTIKFSYLSPSFKNLGPDSELTGWPGNSGVTPTLPAAVRVVIDSAGIGEVERFFSLSVGGP